MPVAARPTQFVAPLGVALALPLCLLLSTPGRVAAQPSPIPNERERRAVRGSPLDESLINESPELREVRRFEELAFPRHGQPPLPRQEPDDAPLPPGLRGRWGGTGDIPAPLRTPELTRGPAREPNAPDSEWLRGLKMPELPVRWEPQLLRFIDFFRADARGRGIMTNWLRRMGRYEELFARILDREGVPRDLIYLAMIESGFEPVATSRVGAGGVWQFMPGTARAYGLEVGYWVDGRRDPERAAEAAARYLKDLHARFGSWHLAFAAYNAGYGAVLNAIASFNTNDFWELRRHEAGLPWETSLYVPKILAAAIIGHNREAFGFGDVAPDPAMLYDRVEVPPGTTLATIARAAGASVETLQRLNPELLRDRTPPDRGPSWVRIPAGSTALFAEAFERTRGPADRMDTVVLRVGETLDDVARARGIAPKELRRLNGLRDSAELRGGATVVVPARPGTAAAAAAAAPDGAAAVIATAPPPVAADGQADVTDDQLLLVAVPDRNFSYDGRERVFYRTRDGDDLEELAAIFGVTADELGEWNALDVTARLHPKMVLQVFVRKDFDPSGVVLLDPGKLRVVTLGSEEFLELEAARKGKTRLYYTAKGGDTLAKIARRFGLSPGSLARINRLSYSSELKDGQRIVVYSPTPELPRETAVGRAQPQPHKRPALEPHAAKSPAVAAGRPGAPAGKGPAPVTAAKAAPPAPKALPAASTKTLPPAGKPAAAPAKPAAPAGKPGAPAKPPTKAVVVPPPAATPPAKSAAFAGGTKLPALSSVKMIAPAGKPTPPAAAPAPAAAKAAPAAAKPTAPAGRPGTPAAPRAAAPAPRAAVR